MKKLFIALAAAALCFVACNPEDKPKDDSGKTEVGLWYGYNTPDSKEDVAIVLEMKADGKADLMLTAWGCRWQGTYTYADNVVKLTWNKFLVRGKAWDLGDDAVSPAHLYDWWVDFSSDENLPEGDYNPEEFGKTIEINFTYSGDTGVVDIANKPCVAERQK